MNTLLREGTQVDFSSDLTPEQVLLEINVNLSKNNPDIKVAKSCILKDGARTYKFAIIHEVISRNTGEHKHFALFIKVYDKLKAGWQEKPECSVSLDTKSGDEILRLFQFLEQFYSENLPNEQENYFLITESQHDLLNKISTPENIIQEILESPDSFRSLLEIGGSSLLKSTIQIAVNQPNKMETISKLCELDIESLRELNSLAGIGQLKNVLEIWNNNKHNSNEEFWQQTLGTYSWVISQIFSYPLVLLAGKAYVGGKWINNQGGNITDFVYENYLTANIILVEIKTPETKLIGSEYRQSFSISSELSGSEGQIMNYRQNLIRGYGNFIANNPDRKRFEAFSPKALLIIGSFETEVSLDHRKKEAFENHRANSRDIDIEPV